MWLTNFFDFISLVIEGIFVAIKPFILALINNLTLVYFALGKTPDYVFWLLLISTIILLIRIPFLTEIVILPYRYAVRFLRILGVVRDNRQWGVVYDSKSKRPIDPAYVTVRNQMGIVVASAVTDLDGRFGIMLPQGWYTIFVEKTNYIFPSQRLLGRHSDGFYTGLYFGDRIEIIGAEQLLSFAIPMDPVRKDWNQKEKKKRNLTFHSEQHREYFNGSAIYFLLLGVFLTARLIQDWTPLMQGLVEIYIGVLIIGIITFLFFSKDRYHSVVLDKKDGKPLSFAKVTVFSAEHKMQIATKTTLLNGQFTCLLPNGEYYVTIERRGNLGQYNLVHTSKPFTVTKGFINRYFKV